MRFCARADGRWSTPAKDALAAALVEADALIVRSATRVTADLIERAPKLRVVGRAGVGVDNIALDAATRRGVLVMNTPGGNAVSVAEHTLALLLSLARRVPQLSAAIHAGRWEKAARRERSCAEKLWDWWDWAAWEAKWRGARSRSRCAWLRTIRM